MASEPHRFYGVLDHALGEFFPAPFREVVETWTPLPVLTGEAVGLMVVVFQRRLRPRRLGLRSQASIVVSGLPLPGRRRPARGHHHPALRTRDGRSGDGRSHSCGPLRGREDPVNRPHGEDTRVRVEHSPWSVRRDGGVCCRGIRSHERDADCVNVRRRREAATGGHADAVPLVERDGCS